MDAQEAYKTAKWAANCKMVLGGLKDINNCLGDMEEHDLKRKLKKIGRELIGKAAKRLPDDLYRQIIEREDRLQQKGDD